MLLGSSPLLMQRGLTESLAGRSEVLPVVRWSYAEMRDAFGMTLDEYIWFGGYPGAAQLRRDEEHWRRYLVDSLIETTYFPQHFADDSGQQAGLAQAAVLPWVPVLRTGSVLPENGGAVAGCGEYDNFGALP